MKNKVAMGNSSVQPTVPAANFFFNRREEATEEEKEKEFSFFFLPISSASGT